MAHSTITDAELLNRATEVFRTYGFDGASLSRLSAATGLEKASLYHRFPGGKDQIAMAVAVGVLAWFQQHIFDPLKSTDTPQKKVRHMVEKLREFYADGTKSCAMDVLSVGGGNEELAGALKFALHAWLKSFQDVAREFGFTVAEARRRAEQAVIQIEGSLILSRVLGDNKPFRHTLDALPALLTAA